MFVRRSLTDGRDVLFGVQTGDLDSSDERESYTTVGTCVAAHTQAHIIKQENALATCLQNFSASACVYEFVCMSAEATAMLPPAAHCVEGKDMLSILFIVTRQDTKTFLSTTTSLWRL